MRESPGSFWRQIATRGWMLVLAYNAQLSSVMQDMGANCFTFHALCSRCLQLARDGQLEEAVVLAESGKLCHGMCRSQLPAHRTRCRMLREIYVRLLLVLGLVSSACILVVGDALQLIYDFDDLHPASLEALRRPRNAFRTGEAVWKRYSVSSSHRLTAPMAGVCEHYVRNDNHLDTGWTASGSPSAILHVCPSGLAGRCLGGRRRASAHGSQTRKSPAKGSPQRTEQEESAHPAAR